MAIFFFVWLLLSIVQLVYWGIIFQRIAWYRIPQQPTVSPLPKVSVIICARNEHANLQKNLDSILTQDYPIFEVLVVDDDSTDETALVLEHFQQKNPHLRIIRIKEKTIAGKKGALAKGIQAAQYDILLLTDADCSPSSNQWIKTMAATLVQTQKSIVLGYGPYKDAATWVNRWVRFETVYVAIQYFSFALWKQPYMGVGRNLMYKKALFEEHGGFCRHEHLLSGDDDLFVNEVATGNNTTICLAPNSFMYSAAPTSWKALYQQKTRHFSSSNHYKLKHKVLLGALSFSHTFFYIGGLIFLLTNHWNYGIIFIFIIRTFLLEIVLAKYLKKVGNLGIFPYIVLFDILVPVYYLCFASALNGKGKKIWK